MHGLLVMVDISLTLGYPEEASYVVSFLYLNNIHVQETGRRGLHVI